MNQAWPFEQSETNRTLDKMNFTDEDIDKIIDHANIQGHLKNLCSGNIEFDQNEKDTLKKLVFDSQWGVKSKNNLLTAFDL